MTLEERVIALENRILKVELYPRVFRQEKVIIVTEV